MAELREVFEMVTRQIEPDQDSWKEQGNRQRRSVRNRKLGALAVVAVITAAIVLFAAKELKFGNHGSEPATEAPKRSGFVFSVVGLDGTVQSSMAGLPDGPLGPDISPDGTSVAFAIQNGEVSQIATLRLDGTGFQIITKGSVSAVRPRWSPDGRRLLFYQLDRKGKVLRLMVMNADGTNARQIQGTHVPDNQAPDWSPDGSLVLYTSLSGVNWGLATVPAAGGHSRRLTTPSGVDDGAGTWSPDGHSIAFKRQIGVYWQIWLMNADGSGQHLLAALPGANAEAPEWSPDGSKVAFIGSVGGLGGVEQASDAVYVVDVASGQVTEVFRGIAIGSGHDGRATWLPGSNALLVTTKAQ